MASFSKRVWERYVERIGDFVPEILKAIADEGDQSAVYELCALALEDFDENSGPYCDMMLFAVNEAKSAGFSAPVVRGAFPDFPEELNQRASEKLERYFLDSYDITEVLVDVVIHYLSWCKRVITHHWSPEEARAFSTKLDETASDAGESVPLIVPSGGGAGTLVCTF
jgi:hypothetical protein